MIKNETYGYVEKAIAGDAEAFEMLCREKMQSILHACLKQLGNYPDAEDASQEILIKLHDNIRSLKSPEAFNTWLYRIIVNECNNVRKRAMKNRKDLPLEGYMDALPQDERLSPDASIEDAETRQQMFAALEKLNSKYYMVMTLYYYEDMKVPEIAKALGLTNEAVRQRLSRGRKILRSNLEKSGATQKQLNAMLTYPAVGSLIQAHMNSLVPPSLTTAFLAANESIIKTALPAAGGAFVGSRLAKIIGILLLCLVLLIFGGYMIVDNGNAIRTLFLGQAPLSTPAGEAGEDPQPPIPSSAGDSIKDSSSPSPSGGAAAQTPGPQATPAQSAPQSPAPSNSKDPGKETQTPPAYLITPVDGRVLLKNHQGDVIEELGQYTQGLEVSLESRYGEQLARTTTGADGSFFFKEFAMAEPESLYLVVHVPKGRFVATGDSPEGKLLIALTPGSGKRGNHLFMKESQVPEGGIELTGGDCACNHVNPSGVTLGGSDVAGARQEWKITDLSGRPIHEGSGAAALAQRLAAMHEEGGAGNYYIVCSFMDSAGNLNAQKKLFKIATHDVQPQEYP